jgi:hypothetical protein
LPQRTCNIEMRVNKRPRFSSPRRCVHTGRQTGPNRAAMSPKLPLMARQQFVAHPFRIHSSPSLAAVRKCGNSLIAEEPCYLRDRKIAITEIERDEIGPELIENFTKPQAFRSQPSRQSPATHAQLRGNNLKPCLSVRQEWSDRVLDRDS